MKKGLIGTFIILLVAFLAITFFKKTPEVPVRSEKSIVNDSTRTDIIEFWNAYHKATDLRTAGDYRQASNYYLSALRFDPGHQNSLYYLGNIHMTLGNFREAEKVWKQLIRINPSSARGYSQLGMLYSCPETNNNLYNLDEGIDHFRRASHLNLEETGPLLQLAKINLAQNQLEKASQQLNDVISSNFRSAEALFLQGYLAWKKADLQYADTLLKQAISIETGTFRKTNVGEGETKKGTSPLTTVSVKCDIYESLIRRQILDTTRTPVTPDSIYTYFDSEFISRY